MALFRPLIVSTGRQRELASGDYLLPAALGSGTADNTTFLRGDGAYSNWLNGPLGIGTTSGSLTGIALRVFTPATGAATTYGIRYDATIQSDSTTAHNVNNTFVSTQAASFTLGTLRHYYAQQNTIGAGSAVTNQMGFHAHSSLSGATNNYGFYSEIASGTGRWNFYANGTASNYFAGAVGIGTAASAGTSLRVSINPTGATTTFGVLSSGAVQSDVTSSHQYFYTAAATQAASFTLTNLYHFRADQGTFGVGSTVTTQNGFFAGSGLIGATNNYGFRGQIAAGTGRWNVYMDGTADNYFAGAVGIGSTSLTGYNLRVERNLTGATATFGIASNSTIQSDVTSSAYGFNSSLGTAAAAFTLGTLAHYRASQGTVGAGSTVTDQYGFVVASNMTGATNNYGFISSLAAGTGRWNFYANGTADNYFAGRTGVGVTPGATAGLRVGHAITGGTAAYALRVDSTAQSDATSVAGYILTVAATQATTYTVTDLIHNWATQGTFGAGSTVASQTAFWAASSLIGATNNYGFRSSIPAGTGRWNFYAEGTASNYFGGSIGIGSTTLTAARVRNTLALTGGATMYGYSSEGAVQSDVTTSAILFGTVGQTAATSFTLSNLFHYRAAQATFGAGSTVANQYGYVADATLTGATNNFGFYSNIAAGTGRWNFYANGTADNYFAGAVGIGSTSLTGYSLRVERTVTGATTANAVQHSGIVQSDVTTAFNAFRSNFETAAASFTVANARHFFAVQNTLGAGSTVTNQFGFAVDSTLTGATNNYGFYSNIAAGTGRWNFYANGTANNYFAGAVGIGSTSLTDSSFRVSRNITGATTAFGMINDGTVLSDVTTTVALFNTVMRTQSAAFTVANAYHYLAQQATLGAGSAITNQSGFVASSALTGATNNYGFRGLIPAGTGRWNVYMDGTADNYFAGAVGIGSTSLSNVSFRLERTITGGATCYAMYSAGVVQSDVTSEAFYYRSNPATQAAAFTLTNLYHYVAGQGTIGAGSAVTNQYGFRVESSLAGATNNFGFYSNIAAGTGRWNFYAAGTADNYFAGSVGIGATTLTGYNFRVRANATGATTTNCIRADSVVQSGVTSSHYIVFAGGQTAASAFTLTNLYYNAAEQLSIGAGSAVTNQFGYYVSSTLTGATNNYGFYSNIASGTGRWNFYANGTASNYFAGAVGIGTAASAGTSLRVSINPTGATTTFGVLSSGAVQSDVTSSHQYYYTAATTAVAAFTLTNLSHYYADQGAFGAGSTVTNQYGFCVSSALTGATNNYGVYSGIAAGTGRWNFYAAGTANNAFAGNVRIGSTTAPTVALDVTGDAAISGALTSRITKRVQTVTSAATVTPSATSDDMVVITAQAVGLTLANPSGTPTQGQQITIRIKDNGGSQTIAYGAEYRAIGVTLPTATTASKTLYLGMAFNSTDTRWDVIAVGLEA